MGSLDFVHDQLACGRRFRILNVVDDVTRECLPEYTPHSFRKTLAKQGDEVCNSMEQLKAWSMNLGHEHLATTVNSYIPVSRERQAELLMGMRDLSRSAHRQSP